MASKFAQFLEEKKIDPRRLMAASKKLERLRPEDRKLKLGKRNAGEGAAAPAADGAEGEDAKPAAPAKPRSGRPVTPQLLAKAGTGAKISGPAKQRLLRAVNHILEQKKQDAVELRSLF